MDFMTLYHPNPVIVEERNKLLENPGFGKLFTDHMVTIRWTDGVGWHDPRVQPRAPFQIDPACAVLHYAQEIFEGMKAYRSVTGDVVLFRPDENAKRFARSACRMAMPPLPETLFLQAVRALATIDRDWMPTGEGSLYLRPFMFADEIFLGVRPAASYMFCVIASPVGPYFKGGEKPISLWVTDEYSRAAQGGTGEAKCGGNYAGSLIAQATAIAQGCDQVVFLDASDFRLVEELGGMNIFFVKKDDVILTPRLGTILPGITRDSIITLARDAGMTVREEGYSFSQWSADAASGHLREVFVCGTAATLVPVGLVRHASGKFTIADGEIGPVTRQLKQSLVHTQRGIMPDTHAWLEVVAG
jgi:branched-chain amino acid aminotransferase